MSEENVNMEEEQPSNSNVEESPAMAATPKQTKLPMAKIKNIMKCDPDANIVSNEAVFITAKATVGTSCFNFKIFSCIMFDQYVLIYRNSLLTLLLKRHIPLQRKEREKPSPKRICKLF